MKLNSFLHHPQIKCSHANKQSKILMNHHTAGPQHNIPLMGVSAKADEAILHTPYLG